MSLFKKFTNGTKINDIDNEKTNSDLSYDEKIEKASEILRNLYDFNEEGQKIVIQEVLDMLEIDYDGDFADILWETKDYNFLKLIDTLIEQDILDESINQNRIYRFVKDFIEERHSEIRRVYIRDLGEHLGS